MYKATGDARFRSARTICARDEGSTGQNGDGCLSALKGKAQAWAKV